MTTLDFSYIADVSTEDLIAAVERQIESGENPTKDEYKSAMNVMEEFVPDIYGAQEFCSHALMVIAHEVGQTQWFRGDADDFNRHGKTLSREEADIAALTLLRLFGDRSSRSPLQTQEDADRAFDIARRVFDVHDGRLIEPLAAGLLARAMISQFVPPAGTPRLDEAPMPDLDIQERRRLFLSDMKSVYEILSKQNLITHLAQPLTGWYK